jgi:hypothetical protein
VTELNRGATATLSAEFLDYPGGPASVVTSPHIHITSVADGSDALADTTSGITSPSTGVLVYSWAVSGSLPLGDYLVLWTVTDAALDVVTATEVVTVVVAPTLSGSWASAADVLGLTGTTVTDAQVSQANTIVEMHAGRTYSVSSTRTGSRDTEWMRRAVAYQAVWAKSQPDLYTRLDFTQVGKDSGTPVGITESAMTLAPLARMALKRVSWLKSRSLHVRSPFVDGSGPIGLTDADDSSLAWTAI